MNNIKKKTQNSSLSIAKLKKNTKFVTKYPIADFSCGMGLF
jgi:hypothetical protein